MEEKLLADTSDEHLPPRCQNQKPTEDADDTCNLALPIFTALLVVFTVWFFYTFLAIDCSTPREPEVRVTVDRAAGLESRVPRAFNLTLSIDNAGVAYEECVGGEAVVLYGRVPLATGVVQELCVPSNATGKVAVFAASGGVGLPTELAELMADEMRGGGAVQLEVRVISDSLKYRFFRCAASLQGGAADPQQPPCKRLVLRDETDGVGMLIVY
uniref:Uncharacterized protein n=1 Tax=Avena sativa TaxID=4498 RepID=A0ACD5V4X5_AVESA